jgi:hypothetical protein
MALPPRPLARCEPSCRPAEVAGDVNAVPWTRSTALERFPLGYVSATHDVRNDMIEARQIAAGKRNSVSCREPQEAPVKPIDPALTKSGGECERNKAELRFAAHRSKIGQTARQGLMAHICRRVTVELKVSAFENEIRGEDQVVFRPRTENCAVITNAADQAPRVRPMACEFPDSIDDHGFSHSETLYGRRFGEHQTCREFFAEGTAACGCVRLSGEFTEQGSGLRRTLESTPDGVKDNRRKITRRITSLLPDAHQRFEYGGSVRQTQQRLDPAVYDGGRHYKIDRRIE